MADETIRPGDLVMVVKPALSCGCTAEIGIVFPVQKIDTWADYHMDCTCCRRTGTTDKVIKFALHSEELGWFELERLKKIQPLDTKEQWHESLDAKLDAIPTFVPERKNLSKNY